MKAKKVLLTTTAAILIGAGAVSAQSVAEQVIAALQEQGYESIEVTTSPTQVKVEAIRGGRKLEAIYDAQTGEILKQEVEAVTDDDEFSPGVSMDTDDEDFLDDDDRDEGDDDSDESDEDDDEEGDDDERDDEREDDEDDDDEDDDRERDDDEGDDDEGGDESGESREG